MWVKLVGQVLEGGGCQAQAWWIESAIESVSLNEAVLVLMAVLLSLVQFRMVVVLAGTPQAILRCLWIFGVPAP